MKKILHNMTAPVSAILCQPTEDCVDLSLLYLSIQDVLDLCLHPAGMWLFNVEVLN